MRMQLVCGALSSDAARAHESAAEIGLDPDRSYSTYDEMFARERTRPDGMEAVAIVTPNHLHHPIARAALQAGFHVICDKPLTTAVAEADELVRLAVEPNASLPSPTTIPATRWCVRRVPWWNAATSVRCGCCRLNTHRPGLRHRWRHGTEAGQWRTDPSKSGPGGAIGDIGSHAFHLACFVTRCVPTQILADLSTFVPGRRVDDNAHVLLRFPNGARGMLWASQVAHGHENALRLRVYGEQGD